MTGADLYRIVVNAMCLAVFVVAQFVLVPAVVGSRPVAEVLTGCVFCCDNGHSSLPAPQRTSKSSSDNRSSRNKDCPVCRHVLLANQILPASSDVWRPAPETVCKHLLPVASIGSSFSVAYLHSPRGPPNGHLATFSSTFSQKLAGRKAECSASCQPATAHSLRGTHRIYCTQLRKRVFQHVSEVFRIASADRSPWSGTG